MEDFDHLLCEKHLNNETLELISAGKFKEMTHFSQKFHVKSFLVVFSSILPSNFSFRCFFIKNGQFKLKNLVRYFSKFEFLNKNLTYSENWKNGVGNFSRKFES